MEKWAKLIHFSGWEISWVKSWFQLISWKLNNGCEELQTAKESGVLIIVDNIKQTGKQITVKHQDPQEGLRYLGVRLSISGNDNNEYQYHLDQAKILAGRVKSIHSIHRAV